MKTTLSLTLDAGFGDRYTMIIDLEREVAQRIMTTIPPPRSGFPPLVGLDAAFQNLVCEQMLNREFRSKLLPRQCQRLGALLAERMADAEGWHDASRVEPAKRQLRTGKPHQ